MTVYILLLLLVISCDFVTRIYNRTWLKKVLLFMCFVMIFVIWGFRDETIGYDTKAYCRFYDTIASLGPWQSLSFVEIGYKLLNAFYITFSSEHRMLIMGNAFLLCMLLWKILCNNSYYPFTCLWLLVTTVYFFTIFDFVRQGLAMGIAYCGLKYLCKKQYLLFSLFVFLAIFFHHSAIVLLILIIFSQIKYSVFREIIAVVLVLLCYIYYYDVVGWFIVQFPNFPYNSYFFVENSNRGGTLLLFITLNILFGIICISNKVSINTSLENRVMAWCFVIGICASILSLRMWWFGRLAIYFNIPVIIFLPNFIRHISGGFARSLYYLSLYALPGTFFLAWIIIVSPVASGYVPYKLML